MTATIALAGNPNVGKSTIFNILTGSNQKVGNWPGKTVEKKEGRLLIDDQEIRIVDLPGTYSLTAYSIEEIIARNYIVNENPTAVAVVLDASNLERNLYLVAQIMELGIPVIVDLNMADVASSRGLKIDAAQLSRCLGGIPVVETVGNRSMGVEQLKEAIAQVIINQPGTMPQTRFEGVLGQELAAVERRILENDVLAAKYPPHWLAAKLLENDPGIIEEIRELGAEDIIAAAEAAQIHIEEATGEDAETLIADQRYSFIGAISSAVLQRPAEAVETASDKIDQIITHRIWGLPIFLLIMWIVFQFTANVSAPYLDWIDGFINETVYGWVGSGMIAVGLGESWLADLATDGIIAGVGGVLVFVPVLLFLYLALAILEDSGYMARAAFVMDRVMRLMGLHGKSFLPMIVGFGCTVPAIYATRTLENEKDRKLTGFLVTFMSCGARLPVYVVFGAAFFGALSGNLIFSMYVLGIGIALLVGYGFKHTVYKGQPPAPFVMELPPYRAPRLSDVLRQTWERTKGFLIKAVTVIMLVSIGIWLLMAIPARADAGAFNDVEPQDSLFGTVSGAVAPVFAPAGFGSWEASGSLITGILAKEVVISTMNVIYVGTEAETVAEGESSTFLEDVRLLFVTFIEAGVLTIQEILNIIPRTINLIPFVELPEFNFYGLEAEEEDTTSLQAALAASFTSSAGSPEAASIAAVAFCVFVLLYVPCMVAISAMRQEFGGWFITAQIGFTLALAWIAAVLVYQIGTALFV